MNTRVWMAMAITIAALSLEAQGVSIAIESFEHNGLLTFNTVDGAAHYGVEWAASAGGPWTNFSSAATLDAIVPPGTGSVTVTVPVFYRVLAVVQPGPLVINEIDYDQPGPDTEEFIEIFNPGSNAVALEGYTVELFNGTNALLYASFALTNAGPTLATNGYLVIGSATLLATVTGAMTLMAGNDFIQNGANDSVRLAFYGAAVDGVAYEGLVPGVGEGSSAPTDGAANVESIQRIPNGIDTDDNGADFQVAPPTPGADNLPPI